jgi:hypothetical protein
MLCIGVGEPWGQGELAPTLIPSPWSLGERVLFQGDI